MEATALVRALERGAPRLPALPFASIHSVAARPTDVEDARVGSFRLRDQRFRLDSPIDWWDLPYRSPDERGFFQNSFVFADPVLSSPGYVEALESLARVFADWIAANPRERAAHHHRYAWHDHAAAARLVYMSFVLREAVRLDRLDLGVRTVLAASVLEHADYVSDEQNYVPTHNHGLFSDTALALAARSIAPADPADRWARLAERRFGAVLARTMASDEGLHLEHSPAYQWTIHATLERIADVGLFEALDLQGTIERMTEAGAWFVAPDGTLPAIGDTPEGHWAPRAARQRAASQAGLRTYFKSGYAVVRENDSYLVVLAAHHPTAHKHADDGSFCLYEGGQAIVSDSGDPGYDYDGEDRRYGTSPAAHSTLSVDDFDWLAGRAQAYGSGLLAASPLPCGAYAILTENPNAVRGGGTARRLFIYRPAAWLIIADAVAVRASAAVWRRIQLAPELETDVGSDPSEVLVRRGQEFVARLRSGGPDAVHTVRGLEHPVLAGFTYPHVGERVARTTILFEGRGSAPRTLVISVSEDTPTPEVTVQATDHEIAAEIWTSSRSKLGLRASPSGIDIRAR